MLLKRQRTEVTEEKLTQSFEFLTLLSSLPSARRVCFTRGFSSFQRRGRAALSPCEFAD